MSKSYYGTHGTVTGWDAGKTARLSGDVPRLTPLVAMSGEWTLAAIEDGRDDTDAERVNRYARVVERLIDMGALAVATVEYDGGHKRKHYEWNQEPKADIRAFLYEMDTLPCGCRAHVPSGRAGADGWMQCNYCETFHTKAQVRECLE